jgi:hypothetical protein
MYWTIAAYSVAYIITPMREEGAETDLSTDS